MQGQEDSEYKSNQPNTDEELVPLSSYLVDATRLLQTKQTSKKRNKQNTTSKTEGASGLAKKKKQQTEQNSKKNYRMSW